MDMTQRRLPRAYGDIQTAVVGLVDRLAPLVPVRDQPRRAHEIAAVLASRPTSMANNMFVRQSIIRGGTATPAQVIEGLATWVTILFDLANLQRDRSRAMDVRGALSNEALERLSLALASSPNGCILALPHMGSNELFLAHLVDRGFKAAFVYSIGANPTPTELWLLEGRRGMRGTPIVFGRSSTAAEISAALENEGVVFMLVDVYAGDRFKGVSVKVDDAEMIYAPGTAHYARAGTPVLPAFATRREADGFSMDILDPLEYSNTMSGRDANADFMQRLAVQIGGFTARHPEAFWLWHPIPQDAYRLTAQRQRPDLLAAAAGGVEEDEAVALAVEALAD